jgi:D-alanyl-D-alanine carboxypeptidase/D-alanyl-D-alanine-endopeptidase (penicillin-binding protein 4)
MLHASASIYIADADNGAAIIDYNSEKSLIPASLMKLISSAAALELLGPEYTFKTIIGYTGSLNRRSGKLKGDIVIRGGGDPALGSKYFSDHYQDFTGSWINEIKKLNIKRIEGRVISDDTYYDFLPVPAKWLIEDSGNYYGAGAYGLSVFDNSYEIHFNTTDTSEAVITKIIPDECNYDLSNRLKISGSSDEGNIIALPYSSDAVLEGTIPANLKDFVLNASIPDPPYIISKILTNRLHEAGITVSVDPTTIRSEQITRPEDIIAITETISPKLAEIIEVMNHESVNLFAEHLIKEIGKRFGDGGSTASGVEVIKGFLKEAGIKSEGMFIEDGSGLSPLDAINSRAVVNLLIFMKNKGRFFPDYFGSLPEAGKDGTLQNYFKDPVFEYRLRAKSGSMTRVRNYAGYFKSFSGKDMAFSIIINNYTGQPKDIIPNIESFIKDLIVNN